MKRILLIISAALILPHLMNAQDIPNGNFEDWGMPNTWNFTPDSWMTSNYQLSDLVRMDTMSFEGEFAMQVNSGGDFSFLAYSQIGFLVNAIPDKLEFAVKTEVNGFPGLWVEATFWNGDIFVLTDGWSAVSTMNEWEVVEIDFENIEPVVDSVSIKVGAQAGDFAYGTGWISVDQMRFTDFTNVEETELSTIQVYPNPVSNQLNIKSDDTFDKIEIYDSMGRLILSEYRLSTIDVSDFAKGNYQLVIYRKDEIIDSKNFIKN